MRFPLEGFFGGGALVADAVVVTVVAGGDELTGGAGAIALGIALADVSSGGAPEPEGASERLIPVVTATRTITAIAAKAAAAMIHRPLRSRLSRATRRPVSAGYG